jgi:hypothetical protein
MTNQTGNDMAHIRDGDPPIKVNREIPLWGLICVIAVIAGQAVTLWFGQQRQAEVLSEMSAQVRQMSLDLGARNLKDVEHDLRLADHERRMLAAEARLAKSSGQ